MYLVFILFFFFLDIHEQPFRKTETVVDCSSPALPPEARLAPAPAPVTLKIVGDGRCQVLGSPSSEQLPDVENNIKTEETPEKKIEKTENVENVFVAAVDGPDRQQLIEEQNRQKKALLRQAILDRKQRTDSEAKRLETAQAELARIDSSLNMDVSFLRNSIEEASLQFMEAQ